MSLKAKLTSLIISFILLATLLIVGVFAGTEEKFTVGGDIEFNIEGIEATISLVEIEGCTLQNDASEDKLADITINDELSLSQVKSRLAKWSGLDLKFDEGETTATITFKITNTSADESNYIGISLSSDEGTGENCDVDIVSSENKHSALISSDNDQTFTITFKVEDEGYKAQLNGFVIDVDMEIVQDTDEYKDLLTFTPITDTTNTSVKAANYNLTEDIKIPAYVKDGSTVYEVTTIDANGFGNGTTGKAVGSKNIIMPGSVTTVGDFAFCCCPNLEYVKISEALTGINQGTFGFSQKLDNIKLPDSITFINQIAFYNCTSLTSIVIPENVETLGLQVFYGCSNLQSAEMGDKITTTGRSLFYNCTNLTSVKLSAGLTRLENYMFYGCVNLEEIEIPANVTQIGEEVFRGCKKIAKIELPEGLTSIERSAFYACELIKEIRLPSSLTTMGDFCFNSCTNLKSIYIPDSVTSLGATIFANCTELTEVRLPANITTIPARIFGNCTALKKLNIPQSVTTIGEEAFYGSGLTTINFGGTETEWNEITGLADAAVPEGVVINYWYFIA